MTRPDLWSHAEHRHLQVQPSDPELDAHPHSMAAQMPDIDLSTRYESCPRGMNPTEIGARQREGDWVHWWISDPRGEITVPVIDGMIAGFASRPGRTACEGNTEYGSITMDRQIFLEWESVGLACRSCAELVHA